MELISQNEIDFFIEHVKESKLSELGSKTWYENHDRLQKLNQQATLEAFENREEYIKNQLISYGKVPILVHEVICISIWREKVLPELLCMDSNPKQSFTLYFILFHETVAVGLLQKILFHEDGVQSLGNNALDLFDHIILSITNLAVGCTNNFQLETKMIDTQIMDEIIEHKHKIQFEVGIACIGLMFNLLLHVKNLALSVTARLTTNNDIPMLICYLLHEKPWIKHENNKQFIFKGKNVEEQLNKLISNINSIISRDWLDNLWKILDDKDNLIPKQEAQLWLSLHEFFTSEYLRNSYEITQFRKKNLLQLQHLLSDRLLDQIPHLLHLKQNLFHLSLSEVSVVSKGPFILEIQAEIRPTILNTYKKQWKKIARIQAVYLFGNDSFDIAKSLSETYENIGYFETKKNICANCWHPAKKKCSKCKKQWYCSRQCQINNWEIHRINCH